MKNIPFFTTKLGVASLTLQEIPYKQEAFIRVHSSIAPKDFLQECVHFCVAAGAERIYVSGNDLPQSLAVYTNILLMACPKDHLGETDAALFPIQDTTSELWRKIYNQKMASVPCSATLSMMDMQKVLRDGDGYFIHRGNQLLGIGKASGEKIEVIATNVPGAGQDVLLAISQAIFSDRIVVEVAEENKAAMKLYDRCGFVKTGIVATWYRCEKI